MLSELSKRVRYFRRMYFSKMLVVDTVFESGLSKSLLDVFYKIISVLDTDREADEVVLDTEKLSVGGGHGTVGHESRVLSEGFDASKTLGKSENL